MNPKELLVTSAIGIRRKMSALEIIIKPDQKLQSFLHHES
jgi:hypothetical protein